MTIDQSIANGEFSVHYQPRFCMKTQNVVSAEALVRWDVRPDVSPGEFIPDIERSGAIEALTMFVTRTVCTHILTIQKALGNCPKISINITPTLFCDDMFAVRLHSLIASYGVPRSLIELEITESSAMNEFQSVITSAHHLRAAGFDIALDDFGTGLSSLHFLDLIPATTLKIDRHFILGLGKRRTSEVIVSSVADMARKTGKTAVAEGVETVEQLQHVLALGYDEVQGFLLAKPMPLNEFLRFIEVHQPLHLAEMVQRHSRSR